MYAVKYDHEVFIMPNELLHKNLILGNDFQQVLTLMIVWLKASSHEMASSNPWYNIDTKKKKFQQLSNNKKD